MTDIETSPERGSAEWVASFLVQLSTDGWTSHPACRELVAWLYMVARQRADAAGVPPRERAEVVQDAMPAIVAALNRSRNRFARAGNPAAVLVRVIERAVACGVHRSRMRGLGGVAANGRNSRRPYPRLVGGEVVLRLLEGVPDTGGEPGRQVEDAAAVVDRWVSAHLDLVLTENGRHAVVYVLDQLVAGRGRAGLVRGNRIGLAKDPAMTHLGFGPAGARAFGAWLLGRADPGHERPGVLDAALLGEPVSPRALSMWRDTAMRGCFAREQLEAAVIPLPARPPRGGRHIA